MGEVGDDGEPKSRSWLRLIETLPSLDRLGPVRPGKPRAIVIHQDLEIAGTVTSCGADPDVRLGPFAGIVQEVPHHLLEVLFLALEFKPWTGLHRELKRPVLIDAVQGPLQAFEHAVDVG